VATSNPVCGVVGAALLFGVPGASRSSDIAGAEDTELRGNVALLGRLGRNGLTPTSRLPLDLLIHIRVAIVANTITAIIMPTIAPAERGCEEPELLALEPASEVRLGIFAKVEKEGSNDM